MSYYSDASLVYIAAAVKNGKTYSVKPTDGTGDLTFSRASNATRVASNGLIEKVRTNIVPYSEEFDNAAWVKQNITVSPNTQTAPDGTLSADKVIVDNGVAFSSTSNYCRTAALTLTTGVVYTVSVYAKADGFDRMSVRMSTATTMGAGPTISINVDLITGLQTGGTIGTYIGRTPAANGYFRYSFQTTSIASATNYLSFVPSDTTATEGNGVDGISIWGAMAEIGDVMTDYIATTTTAVSVGPVSGLPRLDYLNSSCPRLLLEPSRTSLVTFSEQMDNAVWTKSEVTVSANAAISPDGYANSDKIVPSINNATHFFLQNSSVTSGTAYTMSLFAKADGYSFLQIANSGGFSVASRANFDLSNGTVGSNDAGTATITNYGNGWYRLSYTLTADSTTTAGRFVVAVVNSGTAARLAGFVADGTSGVLIYGCQFEAGAYATSYIPTLSTSVTRVAEAASKTGISSLIGQTEGTLFADFIYDGDFQHRFSVAAAGSNNNWIFIGIPESGAGNSRVYIRTNSVTHLDTSAGISIGTFVKGQRYKVAFAYKSGDWAIYINGTLKSSGSQTFTTPSPSFDGFYPSGTGPSGGAQVQLSAVDFNQALLFKTRLTNAQLAELTTL
jgi:hypothetical protein